MDVIRAVALGLLVYLIVGYIGTLFLVGEPRDIWLGAAFGLGLWSALTCSRTTT